MTEEEAAALITDRRGEAWAHCDLCGETFPPGSLRDCDERGQQCATCYEENRPVPIPCGEPGCTNTTYYDDTYGDLCSRHIRAENE